MARIVQFSEAVSLAIHSMVLVAQSKGAINANEIAERTGASRNHLAKVMQQLVKHGFLSSCRGPNGGFALKRPPEKITILQIFECVEGKIETDGCPLDHQICAFDECLLGTIAAKVSEEFKTYFKNHTLRSFMKKNPDEKLRCKGVF